MVGKSSPGRLSLLSPMFLFCNWGFSGLTIGACVSTLFKPFSAVCKGGCDDTVAGPSEMLCKGGEGKVVEK